MHILLHWPSYIFCEKLSRRNIVRRYHTVTAYHPSINPSLVMSIPIPVDTARTLVERGAGGDVLARFRLQAVTPRAPGP